jgi:hypothetical protein
MKTSLQLFFLSVFILFNLQASSESITEITASKAAKQFYAMQLGHLPGTSTQNTQATLMETRVSGNQNLLYIFNMNEQGYVIVSGWSGAVPVLAFSTNSSYNPDALEQAPAFLEMLAAYEKELEYLIQNQYEASPEIEQEWTDLLTEISTQNRSRSVEPLLESTWNQSCYYNELCPEDEAAPYGYCGRVPAGCVALAMAQIMKYWEYPLSGTGSHSYYTYDYGNLSADFANTTYGWEQMQNSTYTSNLAMATLIYHCAVSVEMQFSPEGSGAYTSDAKTSLINYFNYSPEAQYKNKYSYTNSQWEALLRDELDAGRPMIYRGQGTGGHAWVCDGYSADNYFHMNWGWGGYANGYFYLSNLNPAGNNFTSNQAAIIGVEPMEINIDPPQNLTAEVEGNNVNLSWSVPQDPVWMHWDNGANGGSITLEGGGSYNAAARWTPEDLSSYDGMYISQISVYLNSDDPTYQVKIWTGENGANLVYTQNINSVNAGAWNTIELNNPFQIDASDELMLGITVNNQANGIYSVGFDTGPAILQKGDLLSFDGNTWMELVNFGINKNWNLQALVSPDAGNKSAAGTAILAKDKFENSGTNFSFSIPDINKRSPSITNRGLLGFNIYRNDSKINTSLVENTNYTDENPAPGIHTYYVTSVHNTGESEASNLVTVTAGMATHTLELSSGWNSISSFLNPSVSDIESICNPIMGDMIIMQNLYDLYYPHMNINTIDEWEYQKGYLIKVEGDCQLPIQGYASDNKTLQLNNGWNLISVLSDCDVDTEELFSGITSYIRIVKDAAGTGVYWPSMGINSLPVMKSGKAYYVKIFTNKTITFPACE